MKEKLNNLPNSYKENIKKATKILKILLFIFIIWIIFAIADCFRISNLNEKSKPLITIATKEYNNILIVLVVESYPLLNNNLDLN